MNENAPVLLVEDNSDDVFLMRRAVKKSGVTWNLQVVMDGEKALEYLNGAGKFADRNEFPMPALVFLDLKLPYVGGFDVLTAMQGRNDLKEIPVVILTSSPEARDQKRAMELGAKLYLIKPPGEETLQKLSGRDWNVATNDY